MVKYLSFEFNTDILGLMGISWYADCWTKTGKAVKLV